MNPDLLPSSALPSERALSLAAEFSEKILPEDIRKLWSAEDAPARFLPYMAWGLHVDFWRDSLPDDEKRGLIAEAFEWHRLEGTFGAIRRICEAVNTKFGETKVQAWYEYGGEPYGFRVLTSTGGRLAGPEAWKELREAIGFAQALRDRLDAIVVEHQHESVLYAGTATLLSPRVTIRPEQPDIAPAPLFAGTATLARAMPVIGLPRPELGATDAYAGMSVTVASFVRTGKLSAPRPPFEIWPSYTKAGIATSTVGRMTLYPAAPGGAGRLSAGAAVHVTNFITLTQEAM